MRPIFLLLPAFACRFVHVTLLILFHPFACLWPLLIRVDWMGLTPLLGAAAISFRFLVCIDKAGSYWAVFRRLRRKFYAARMGY